MRRVHPWEHAWRTGNWKEVSPPLPAVEEFCDYLAENRLNRVLDLGAGGGRHTLLMARKGFRVVALDVSETALSILDRRLGEAGLRNVSLVKHDMSRLPFIDGYFDGVVSTNVMHHGLTREVNASFGEAFRVMRSGGAGMFVVVSDKDFRFGSGKRLEAKTYAFTRGEEKGIVHHFFGLDEFKAVLKGFRVIELREELLPEKAGKRAHIYATVRKP
jgi:tellurite methyltransferase